MFQSPNRFVRLTSLLGAACLLTVASAVCAEPSLPEQTAEQIRNEAARPNQSDIGRPLPLATTWDPGIAVTPEYFGIGFPPIVQMGYIEAGHHILLMFNNPPSDETVNADFKDAARRDKWLQQTWESYGPATEQAAKLGVPIAFTASQWESTLIYDKGLHALPADRNPAVIDLKGNVTTTPDPMGPVDLWYQVGRQYSDNDTMKKMEELYPNPPLVEFYSNNEEAKLNWANAETSKRYVDKYGLGHDKEFMHKVVMDGYVERYRALQNGIRDGLNNPNWKKAAIFTGYDTFGLDWSRAWDGGTPSYYVNNWQATTDYTVLSPQIYLQRGWIPTLKKMREATPNFRFEMSTWDGSVGGATDKRQSYIRLGQSYDANRYEGYVQFGLWLLQPRVIEDFRSYNEPRSHIEPYFMALVHSVDRIYDSPELRRFWRQGELVPNRAHPNPGYEIDPPKPPETVPTDDRWFNLDTNLDARRPWTNQTEIPVYSLAYVLGKAPEREWLVFAYAPLGARTKVRITLPDFGPITVDAPQTGSFYTISEKTHRVLRLLEGGPASVLVETPHGFQHPGEPISFSATNIYKPGGALNSFAWNFGDGGTATGVNAQHTFSKPGPYLVSLHAGDGQGTNVDRTNLVLVGAAQPGQVLNFAMIKNEDPFVYDASGQGNLGFRSGGKWVDDPDRGTVLELNGQQDYVGITDSPDINTAKSYANRTIMLCFKATTVAPKRRQTLYEEGGSGNGMNIYLDGNQLYGGIWEGGVKVGTFISTGDIVPNRWYHAAIVLRNAEANSKEGAFELYLDGVPVPDAGPTAGSAAAIPEHVGDINFGRSGNTRYHDRTSDGPGEYFAGRLGGLQIYNRALTPDEIAAAAKE